MAADVRMKFFGNEADAERAIVSLEKKYDDLLNKVNQVSKQSRKGSKDSEGELVKWGKGLISLAAGYELVSSAVRAAVDQNVKLSQAIDEVLGKLPENQIKLQIQTGMSAVELEKQMPKIEAAVLATPTTDLFGAMDIQRGLAGADFQKKDIQSGQALQAVLDLKAATIAFGGEAGGDPLADAMSLTQFLKGMGNAQPSAGQVFDTGARLASLFAVSDVKFSDLGALAPIASSLQGYGLDEQTQLAAFSTLVDLEGGPKAATGLMQVTGRLRTASQLPKAVGALESLGLTPADVDLVGEDFTTALERLRDASDKADENTRSNALYNIFGQDATPSASMAMGNVDRIKEFVEAQETSDFEKSVEMFRDSRYARNQRTEIDTQIEARGLDLQRGGVTYEEARDELTKLAIEKAVDGGGAWNAFNAAGVGLSLSTGEAAGISPEQALEDNTPGGLFQEGSLQEGLREFIAEQKKQTEELRKIYDNLHPPNRNRNPNGEQ